MSDVFSLVRGGMMKRDDSIRTLAQTNDSVNKKIMLSNGTNIALFADVFDDVQMIGLIGLMAQRPPS